MQPHAYPRHWLIIIIDESIPKTNNHCILFISVAEEKVEDVELEMEREENNYISRLKRRGCWRKLKLLLGSLIDSQEVFNVIPQKNVGLWNNLIAFYMKYEHYERALEFFKQMQLEGITHDTITYACSLKACSNISAIHKGNEIHCVIEKASFVDKNSVIGNVLVYMYAKNGFLTQAQ